MDAAKGPTREDAMRRINLLWSVVLKSPTVSYGSMKTVAKRHNCILSQLYSIESQRYRLLLLKEKNYNSKEVPSVALDLRGSERMAVESTIFNRGR